MGKWGKPACIKLAMGWDLFSNGGLKQFNVFKTHHLRNGSSEIITPYLEETNLT